ncbi:MAG: hypothetical protein HOO91_07400 [Bacteroidales bacterium]|nr:hypothetical protein [Bacteroidales bacterium]
MKWLLITITLAIGVNIASAQPCRDYNRMGTCLVLMNREDMNVYGQSKNALLQTNVVNSFSVTLFGEKDYKFIVCSEAKFYPIHIRLIDPVSQEVFYDNKDDDYLESIGFTIEKTRRLIVEITLLAAKAEIKDIGQDRACVGVLILWQKVPKTGF